MFLKSKVKWNLNQYLISLGRSGNNRRQQDSSIAATSAHSLGTNQLYALIFNQIHLNLHPYFPTCHLTLMLDLLPREKIFLFIFKTFWTNHRIINNYWTLWTKSWHHGLYPRHHGPSGSSWPSWPLSSFLGHHSLLKLIKIENFDKAKTMRINECFMGATFSDPNLGMALEMALATQESRYKD